MADPVSGVLDPAAGEKNVPIEVVTALKDQVKDLKSTVEIQGDQIKLYQANQPVKTETVNQGNQGVFEGKEDDDIITIGDVKRIMAGQDAKISGLVAGLGVRADNSDFVEVVNKYVPILAKERPDLAEAIKASGNPALLAYEFCKSLPQYQKDLAEAELKGTKKDDKGKVVDTENLSEAAKKLLANQEKPGSASGAPSGGGGTSTAEYYAKMSEDDLEKKIDEVKARA